MQVDAPDAPTFAAKSRIVPLGVVNFCPVSIDWFDPFSLRDIPRVVAAGFGPLIGVVVFSPATSLTEMQMTGRALGRSYDQSEAVQAIE